MATANVFTPYSTIAPWFKGKEPGWVPDFEQQRIASYAAYRQIYWNWDDDFKLVARGTDDVSPIYVPRGRIIVDTLHRYVGAKFDFMVDPDIGTPGARDLAKASLTQFFKRERVLSRYNSAKRFGLVDGDWVWHLMADPNKPQGSRLRLLPVRADSYFPVYLNNDPERLVKVHLADRYLNTTDSKFYIRRRTYTRVQDGTGAFTGQILVEQGVYEDGKWYTEADNPITTEIPPTPLDPRIEAIPVFHIPNFDEPGNNFGSSEMRGMERLIAGLNQAISDEDMALALMGLGVYATESTQPPVNAQGVEVDWTIYPGKVIQGAVGLKKVEGITSVSPYTEHYNRMTEELGLATGATTAATGTVDVQVAESGVALAMRLAPILAIAEEKDQIIEDVMGHLLFNVQRWWQVYEGVDFTEASVEAEFGEKLPRNKASEVDLCVKMMSTDPPIMSAATARTYLVEHAGFDFDEAEEAMVYAERKAITAAGAPPLGDHATTLPAGVDPFADRAPADGGQQPPNAPPQNAAKPITAAAA